MDQTQKNSQGPKKAENVPLKNSLNNWSATQSKTTLLTDNLGY